MDSEKYNPASRRYWRRNPYRLCAPREYWTLTDAEHRAICNGVGSRVGWWAKLTYHLIPNTIWFMGITPVSDIHDFDYTYPKRFASKLAATSARLVADNRFLANGDKLVMRSGGPEWLRTLRRIRLDKYHLLLRECGEASFLAGKTIG